MAVCQLTPLEGTVARPVDCCGYWRRLTAPHEAQRRRYATALPSTRRFAVYDVQVADFVV
eukprot:11413298-Alexandrium_andersonii.AAC.1